MTDHNAYGDSSSDGPGPLRGRIAPERIRLALLPAFPPDLIAGFVALGSATAAVSDALDALNLAGAVGCSDLRPTISNARMVGRALTMRNVPRDGEPATLAREGRNLMGDLDAHLLAEPGDVIVIEGVSGSSNMGGIAAQIGHSRGEAGAVVAGGVRDVGESSRAGYPIWSSHVTPLTGKWRVETVEINGPISVFGVPVAPGDLVVADENGVCFVPHAAAEQVLKLAHAKSAAEVAALKAHVSRSFSS